MCIEITTAALIVNIRSSFVIHLRGLTLHRTPALEDRWSFRMFMFNNFIINNFINVFTDRVSITDVVIVIEARMMKLMRFNIWS